MKGLLERFAGLAVLCLTISLVIPSTVPAKGSPKIVAQESVFNFGSIYSGNTVKHVFKLRNSGSDTLRIDNVRSSCGCTVAMLEKQVLAPGESTSIQAEFNSARFAGRVQKDIYVQSNDPETQIVKLSLEGEVLVDLSAEPSRIYFSGLKKGERLERKVTIRNSSEISITIKEISTTVPELRFELDKPRLKPGETASLNLIVDKVTSETKLTGALNILHTSPQKELTIQLYGGSIN